MHQLSPIVSRKTEVPSQFVRTLADELAISQGCYWHEATGLDVIRWIESNIYIASTNERIRLTDVQKHFLMMLYSWRKPNGKRRFRKCLLTTGKKSFGKTLLAAALALYHLCRENILNPNCIMGAATREQAGEMFREVHFALRANEHLEHQLHPVPSQKTIRHNTNNGLIRAVSQESAGKGGMNVSLCLLDEVALHKDSSLYEMLKGSGVARGGDDLLLMLSNAGYDKTHFYYTDIYQPAKAILSGDSLDIEFLPYIYELPEEADWNDETLWHLALPCLDFGGLASLDSIRSLYREAKENQSNEMYFRRFFCNQFTSKANAWLDLSDWDACKVSEWPALNDKPFYAAIDLSHTNDLTSIVACYPIDGRLWLKSWNFATRHSLERREKANLRDYRVFAYSGHLTIVEGNAIDYQQIRSTIKSIPGKCQLLIFDKYSSLETTQQLERENYKVVTFPQTHAYYSEPCKRFENLVRDHLICHDGNQCLRWCVNNTQLDANSAGLVKPSKSSQYTKIDAAVCAIMATSQALLPNNAPKQPITKLRWL